jgi:hypothetical protein
MNWAKPKPLHFTPAHAYDPFSSPALIRERRNDYIPNTSRLALPTSAERLSLMVSLCSYEQIEHASAVIIPTLVQSLAQADSSAPHRPRRDHHKTRQRSHVKVSEMSLKHPKPRHMHDSSIRNLGYRSDARHLFPPSAVFMLSISSSSDGAFLCIPTDQSSSSPL